MKNRRII